MSYHLSEGMLVIVITLVFIGLFLFLTRKAPWTFRDKLLLLMTVICYCLDTIWWLFNLHYSFTDIYFQFAGHTEQLTIFFICSFITFVSLIFGRYKRLKNRK
ncbi:hypothetical protein ACYSNW_12915 [Enterococcus sp. LJL99]